jgi:hypothetical protein
VLVENHVNEKTKIYEGSPELILRHILFDHPFLRTGDPEYDGDLSNVIDMLDSQQSFSVEVEHNDITKSEQFDGSGMANSQIVHDMMGFDIENTPEFLAAAFLAGTAPSVTPRQAVYESDGNVEYAALRCYGLELTDKNLQALRSVKRIRNLNKSETEVRQPSSVEAALPEGEDVAQEVSKAFKDQFVFEVNLSGKHSKGSLLAHNNENGDTWLLKPDGSSPGSAQGVEEEKAPSSSREAAFYHVAKEVEMYQYYPRCELLIIDGQHVAVMKLLPWTFKTMDHFKKEDPSLVRKTLQPYLADGTLHKWAALDLILGNPDSHSNNVMMNEEGDVRLIDHGSAFAGADFDPANDRNSFIPGYLRVWAPDNFKELAYKERNRYMPRVSEGVAKKLSSWLNGIHAETLAAIVYRYGIDPKPSLDRLAKLKGLALEMPVDRALTQLWLTT